MTIGNKSYHKPMELLASICDNNGNQLIVGDQKDLHEFNEIFISRIIEGLQFEEAGELNF